MKKIIVALIFPAMAACVTPQPVDYTQFRESHPTSILILPPINHSRDITASQDYLSLVSRPIAERGFYVFPVAVVEAYFKSHGLSEASDIHQIPLNELQKAFAPDAVLYLEIDEWGSAYQVLASTTKVQVRSRLFDAVTGVELWSGTHHAVAADSGGGDTVAGILLYAAMAQIVNDTSDAAKRLAGRTGYSHYHGTNGLLVGPLSPSH